MADTYNQGEARGYLTEAFFERWSAPEGWDSIAALSTEPSVNWDNVHKETGAESPPDTDACYLELVVRHADNAAATLGGEGQRRFTERGFVRVDFYVPLDAGMGLRDELSRVVKYCLQPRRLTGEGCGIVIDRVVVREVGPGPTHYDSYALAFFHYDSVE